MSTLLCKMMRYQTDFKVVKAAAFLCVCFFCLFCGDSLDAGITQLNYYTSEAGINLRSSLMRRIARMTGTSLQEYIIDGLSE